MVDTAKKGRREFSLAAMAIGALLLAGLPLALALFGSPWHAAVTKSKASPAKPELAAQP
jgi:hypothetical protein